MSLLLIIAIVFILYARTLNYYYVIDDNVKREGYMYDVPLVAPDASFWNKKPSPWYRLFMISMHCVNVSIIYMIFGWAPAFLFAVHPIGVIGTAWVTGNYYATATYFTLIAFYFIQTFDSWWSSILAMPFYVSALNSTVCPITFPFIFLFAGSKWGLLMFLPLAIYLRGKKFTTGIKIRKGFNNEKFTSSKFHFRRTALMTKVVARYIYNTLVPMRMGFFDGFGHRLKERKDLYNKVCSYNYNFWACFALCLVTFFTGLKIHVLGTMWFFCFVMLHSQWNFMGQFFALRYLYLAMVGMCVVVGTLLQPYPVFMAIVGTILALRTHFFIYAWRDQRSLWENDKEVYPNHPQTYNSCAQYYLGQLGLKPGSLSGWRINAVAADLFKAEEMEPDSWETQMNIACFYAQIGHLDECLARTEKAMELLKPLGGISKPIEMLTQQRENIKKIIEEVKAKLKQQGCATTSHPTIQQEAEKVGVENDTRKRDSETSNGSTGVAEPEGREERLAAVA